MTLPNFIVIGAPKAGTTSLHAYLRSHPDVFMPERKELDFFVTEYNWKRGQRWYEQWFSSAPESMIAIGEASPRYAMCTAHGGVPERMAQVVPDAKLIYVVRDPVARMLSHYRQMVGYGRADPQPGRALLTDPTYLDTSRYGFQLEQYMRLFSREQILVVVTEELREQRRKTIDRVLTFLGLEATQSADHLIREHNVTAGKRGPRPLLLSFMSLPGWKWVSASLPERAKTVGRQFTHRPLSRIVIAPDVRRELESRLRDDVALLRSYMPPDFDGWGIA